MALKDGEMKEREVCQQGGFVDTVPEKIKREKKEEWGNSVGGVEPGNV